MNKKNLPIAISFAQVIGVLILLYWLVDVIFEPSLWIGFLLFGIATGINHFNKGKSKGFSYVAYAPYLIGCLIMLFWLLGSILEPSLWLAFLLLGGASYVEYKNKSKTRKGHIIDVEPV
jgi:hypothetical protein